jgi:hypothetical protein
MKIVLIPIAMLFFGCSRAASPRNILDVVACPAAHEAQHTLWPKC